MAPGWLDKLKKRLGLGGGAKLSPGSAGERAAAAYLEKAGYRILGVNLKCDIGEIDILAMAPDGKTVVVVEVKTREEASGVDARYDATRPEERVGRAKQKKLAVLAAWAVRRYRLENHRVRFDVVGVDLRTDGKHDVRHYPGAFEAG